MIDFKLNRSDLKRVEKEFSDDFFKAAARMLNEANKKAAPITRRALVQEIGFPSKVLSKLKLRRWRARPRKGSLVSAHGYKSVSVGLEVFNARQTRKGVSARLYGKRQFFPGAFIVKERAKKAGGLVMRRKGRSRLPIERPAKVRLMIPRRVWREVVPIVKRAMDNFETDIARFGR